MSLCLPPQMRPLAWIAGTTWPDGDEDGMWADAAAWEAASTAVRAVLDDIDGARTATLAAYPSGAGAAQMTALFDGLHDGDGSVRQLADYLDQIYNSCFDMGTEIQDTKLTIILSLAWLSLEIFWAWAFPPTASAVEAAAIASTRSSLRLVEDAALDAIKAGAERLGAFAGRGRLFWKSLAKGEFVLPSAKGIASYSVKLGENALGSLGLDVAVQAGQMMDGKRHHFNGTESGLSVLGSAAGAIPSREFARYLGAGIDRLAGDSLGNFFGRTGRGSVIGSTSGAVSSLFGNVAVGAATGDFSSLSSPSSWAGGMARGGIVGGVRGAAVKASPVTRGDIRYRLWAKGRGEVKNLPTDGSVTDIPADRLPEAAASAPRPDAQVPTDSHVTDGVNDRPVVGSNHGEHEPDTGSVHSTGGESGGSDTQSPHSAGGGSDTQSLHSTEGSSGASDIESICPPDDVHGDSASDHRVGPDADPIAANRPVTPGHDPVDSIIDMYGDGEPSPVNSTHTPDAPVPSAPEPTGVPRPNPAASAAGPGDGSRPNPAPGEGNSPTAAPPPGRKYPTDPMPDQSGFLGKATDMKSKTRPKREPEWERLPEGYRAKSAPPESFWEPETQRSPDIPWRPPKHRQHHHEHHHEHPPERSTSKGDNA